VGDTFRAVKLLGNGFIVTALLWGAAGAELIDGRFRRSAVFFFTAGALCLFGVIHSPAPQGTLFLPWQTSDKTPFTFAAAYVALGIIVLAAPLLSRREEPVLQEG
jgi:AGZA family xanthine/uracil permease-like MFS transporter